MKDLKKVKTGVLLRAQNDSCDTNTDVAEALI